MTDPTPYQADRPASADQGKTGIVIYALYLASLVVGITAVIGVVMAYVHRNDAPAWVQTHYRFQIRTFWIGLLFSLIGIVTAMAMIGWLILLLVAVWLIVRCVKGLSLVSKGEAHPDPTTWLF